ncbi:MAG: hypothetical protein QW587_04735 [Candidatus Bathyarchaeia archaeon]
MSGKQCTTMSNWIKEGGQKICRPCVLPILIQWYQSELTESGREHLARRLSKLVDKADLAPEEVAEELDRIKETVDDASLKLRLREFDCTIQASEEPPSNAAASLESAESS